MSQNEFPGDPFEIIRAGKKEVDRLHLAVDQGEKEAEELLVKYHKTLAETDLARRTIATLVKQLSFINEVYGKPTDQSA